MKLRANVSINLSTDAGMTVDPCAGYDQVTVLLGDDIRIYSTHADVLEQAARAFWDAADELRAKQQPADYDPIHEVAKTLSIATGGAA